MRRSSASALAAVTAALCLAGCGSSTGVIAVYPQYTFSCCVAGDVQRVWHPGETMVIHWITDRTTDMGGDAGQAAGHTVTLSAVLTGPYADVNSLKAGGRAAVTLSAAVLSANDQAAGTFVSRIALPESLPAGFYNLDTSTGHSGGSASGGSIVQVRAVP